MAINITHLSCTITVDIHLKYDKGQLQINSIIIILMALGSYTFRKITRFISL